LAGTIKLQHEPYGAAASCGSIFLDYIYVRPSLRWRILATLNAGRPNSVQESLILHVANDLSLNVTVASLRRELDYLEEKELVRVQRSGHWSAELTGSGIDVVEYTIDCPPGIDRPAKF